MKTKPLKCLLAIVMMLSVIGCAKGADNEPQVETTVPSVEPEEENVIGIWFSYLEYQSMVKGMDEEAFRAFTQEAVANMQSIGVNTLYLHAVAFTDAFYDSSIYPRTAVLPDITYDPFGIFTETAKAAGLKVHAWINPMRSVLASQAESLPQDFIIRQWIDSNDERVRQSGDRLYLNPAYPDVRKLIVSVAEELIDKYDIDGIHMDDYFYPSQAAANFDAYVYSLAKQENESLTLDAFRISNTDALVKELHDAVKAKNPDLQFGISPAGNIQNCIMLVNAVPYHWVEQGTVDYLIPQIYWGFLHPVKPFEPTMAEWKEITDGTDTELIIGLAAYNLGLRYNLSEDETVNAEWEANDDMMARQMASSFDNGCDGVAFYSYSSFFQPDPETQEIVDNEILHIKNYISQSRP